MLNPSDPQDVQRAIKLLQGIVDIRFIPLDVKETLNGGDLQALKELELLGIIIGLFLHPFTSVDMPLSDQLKKLAQCSHIMIIVYREMRTKFLPAQLYFDMQCTIKNVFLTTAKLHQFSEKQFLLLEGDDELEKNFGMVRVANHNHGVTVLSLVERQRVCSYQNQIFLRRPEWYRGHKRLSMHSIDGDNQNCASIRADVSLEGINLNEIWSIGRQRALLDISQSELYPCSIDYWASLNEEVTMLKPFGQYVGVDGGLDTQMENEENPYWSDRDQAHLIPVNGHNDGSVEGINENGETETFGYMTETIIPDIIAEVQSDESIYLNINGKNIHKASAVSFFCFF